jgi:hypothetical protein
MNETPNSSLQSLRYKSGYVTGDVHEFRRTRDAVTCDAISNRRVTERAMWRRMPCSRTNDGNLLRRRPRPCSLDPGLLDLVSVA